MAGGNFLNKYGTANQAITCTFGNNPTGTISQHGRISNAVSNASDCFEEVLIHAKLKSGTSPSGNKQFIVFGLGAIDGGTIYTDGFTAGDADSSVLVNTARAIGYIPALTSTTTVYGGPWPLSLAFGCIPDHWALYVFNDHGVTPSTTNADHAFWYQGLYGQYT